MEASRPRQHLFYAVAFVENLNLRELVSYYPEGRVSPHDLHLSLPEGGDIFLYGFGAVVFHDVSADRREAELQKLREVRPNLTTQIILGLTRIHG